MSAAATPVVGPAAVARARAMLPCGASVHEASRFLKALADPTRFRLLAALAEAELCVGDLATVLGASPSAVSHQLRLLRAHRLVAVRRLGRHAFYRLDDAHVAELVANAIAHAREPGAR